LEKAHLFEKLPFETKDSLFGWHRLWVSHRVLPNTSERGPNRRAKCRNCYSRLIHIAVFKGANDNEENILDSWLRHLKPLLERLWGEDEFAVLDLNALKAVQGNGGLGIIVEVGGEVL
jgi:hypothetical protein